MVEAAGHRQSACPPTWADLLGEPMTAESVHTENAVAVNEVRVCGHCGRPLPALDKNEYTPTRARLVATAGFCVCPPGTAEGEVAIPDRAPSLL
jgi:hypothetical protein